MDGRTIFDESTAPATGRAGNAGLRQNPPLTPAYEEIYKRNINLVATDRFPDPLTNCGIPAGFPRIMNVPDVYEFVVRPEQVWILSENGPGIARIYTDGRDHPDAEDMWPTFTGDSVGHWEGDTLVFDTIGVRGEKGSIIDRTGLVLSDQMHIVTRVRKIDDKTLEAKIEITDPLALTTPWLVTKHYKKMPAGTRVYDYACAENNRNPVTDSDQTVTLGPDGKPLDRKIEGKLAR
jgi:hypothetical protein